MKLDDLLDAETKFEIGGDMRVVAQVFFIGLHDLEQRVVAVMELGFCLTLELGQCVIARDVVADLQVVAGELEPLAFYPAMLEDDMQAFF